MTAPEPLDMAGPDYRDIETQADSRSGAVVVLMVICLAALVGVALFWFGVGLVWEALR